MVADTIIPIDIHRTPTRIHTERALPVLATAFHAFSVLAESALDLLLAMTLVPSLFIFSG
jgi:hypothetical protein